MGIHVPILVYGLVLLTAFLMMVHLSSVFEFVYTVLYDLALRSSSVPAYRRRGVCATKVSR